MVWCILTNLKGKKMKNEQVEKFCNKNDCYEYGIFAVITMPDGFRFIGDGYMAEKYEKQGATVEFLSELGE